MGSHDLRGLLLDSGARVGKHAELLPLPNFCSLFCQPLVFHGGTRRRGGLSKQAMKAGLGTSILSRRAIAEELDNGSLVEMKLGEQMRRTFYVATHKKRSLPSHYMAFLDFLEKGRKR